MSDRIFISYRRSDTSGYSGRLFDRLSAAFGRDRVFMDIEAIEPGSDFVDTIDKAVGSCGALVAVIGKRWLEATDDQGRRRLDNPNDFIRVEIASALKRDVRIVPLLVNDAVMPQADDLPEDMAPLCRLQALELSDIRWDYDVGRLIDFLDRHLEAGRSQAEASSTETAHTTQHSAEQHTQQQRSSEQEDRRRSPATFISATVFAFAIAAVLGYLALRPAAEETPSPTTDVTPTLPKPATPVANPPTEPDPKPAEATVAGEAQDAGAGQQLPEPSPEPSPPAEVAQPAATAVPDDEAPQVDVEAALVERLLIEAEADIPARRLMRPPGNNAFERYAQVLELRPGHPDAVQGLTRVSKTYREMAGEAFAANRYERGIALLSQAAEVVSIAPELEDLRNAIDARAAARRQEQKEIEAQAAARRAEQEQIDAREAARRDQRRERDQAREACLQRCEDTAGRCRERAPAIDPKQCLKDVEKRCRKVYDECLPQALIFGEVSADSECTGRQIACEQELLPRCEQIEDAAADRCEREAEACQQACPQ